MLDLGLYVFYGLLAIAVLAAIIFPILNAIKTPAALLKSLIGIGSLLVLFGIAYAVSAPELSQKSATMVGPNTGKLIGAGLIMFYITLLLSILAVVYSEITKALK